MARRTLWDVANASPGEVGFGRSFVAWMTVFCAGLFAVILIIAIALWCWGQHWLVGLIATVCPIIGLYYTVTKEPSR